VGNQVTGNGGKGWGYCRARGGGRIWKDKFRSLPMKEQ